MIDDADLPLVTFALFAFNQERYVRQAVQAALEQDYPRLQIILSDDCSSDATFELMSEMAESYTGPHSIKLNRNPVNLGIGRHINVMMEMVDADFVVIAAGDDVSEPNRTAELTRVWLESERRDVSIFSSVMHIDANGKPLGLARRGSSIEHLNSLDSHASQANFVMGASHGWDMRLIRNYEPLLSVIMNEDVILAARGAITGRVSYVDKPLVRYRLDSGVSFEFMRRREQNLHEVSIQTRKQRYYCWLQKFRDFKNAGVLGGREQMFAKSRATALYPIWLRSGRLTRLRCCFFLKRCILSFLLMEYVKYRFPMLVALKHRLLP
ncbi:MAG: glycosyltransferase [bacterium]